MPFSPATPKPPTQHHITSPNNTPSYSGLLDLSLATPCSSGLPDSISRHLFSPVSPQIASSHPCQTEDASGSAASQHLLQAIRSIRTNEDRWSSVQDFTSVTSDPMESEINDILVTPKSSDVTSWNDLDTEISNKLQEIVPSQTELSERVSVFKSTIFDTFNNRFGTKPRIQTEGKQKIHVDEQKKKLRKLKKESKRKYKELIRSAADEQEVTDERTKWNKLVRLHNKIRLQELEVQKVEEQATNNTEFSKNPFDFIKHHVTKGKPSNLKPACNIDEATKFFTDRYEDKTRDEKLDFPFFIPLAATPSSPIDIDPPSKVEIDEYVKSRRNKSSPGPDGIPYLIYKKCPKIRDFMIYLIRECWVNCVIPDRDKLALKFLLPKTESSTNLDDFRDITLFNAFIKVLFGVWARRVTKFMIKNKFINTNIQKGFVPNISGCVEHNQTLHDVLKNDKRDGKPVQVTFLDLKNAFGSIKHNFIVAALRWYHVPEQFINIFKLLYSNCHVVVKVNNDLTPPIPVKIGSLQGGPEAGICFNIPWNIPLEAIYIKARDLGAIPEDKPVSAFADDLTTKTNDDTKMQTLLNFISSTFDWSKCLQLNTKKCKVLCINERGEPSNVDLTLNGKKINHLENSPFKFLGRWIYPSLSDVE